MIDSWIVLIPPLLVLLFAFTTHRVISALFIGIISAALILHNGAPIEAIKTIVMRFWYSSDLQNVTSWNGFISSTSLLIFLFLFVMGILVTQISHSGGAHAYGTLIRKKIKDARSAEIAAMLFSFIFFIDDSFSCVTVGSIMQPITDKFHIARAKLAFIVDSLASPVCLLAPISSWVPVIVMQLQMAGVGNGVKGKPLIVDDSYYVFLKLIPYAFYSLILIASVWFIIRKRISFGLMYSHEKIAREKENLFGGKAPQKKKLRDIHESNIEKESIIDFVFPLITLITSVVMSILYFGGYYLLGGSNPLMQVIRHSNISLALFIGGLFTLIASSVLFFIRKRMTLKTFPAIVFDGIKLMYPCIIVLLLAWVFSSLLRDDLGTGIYLAKLIIGKVPLIFVPVLFLIVSAITASAMGSSWGALAVMIPIAVPMIVTLYKSGGSAHVADLPLLLPTLGAVLSGCVIGSHLSPVSDTTILAAKSSGSYILDHAKTQLWYAIPSLISTAIAFVIAGVMAEFSSVLTVFIAVGVGICTNIIILSALNKAHAIKRNFDLQRIK